GRGVQIVKHSQAELRHRIKVRYFRKVQAASKVKHDRSQGVADAHLVAESVQAVRVIEGAYPVSGEHLVGDVATEAQRVAELLVVTISSQQRTERSCADLVLVEVERLSQRPLQLGEQQQVQRGVLSPMCYQRREARIIGD